MPLKKYGVLKGRAIDARLGQGSSPHYQVHIVDDELDYRIAINVKSKLFPSELLYLVNDDFAHPILEEIVSLPNGFTPLESKPTSSALDYIRGNLFDMSKMKPLPHNVPGPDNDLNELIDAYVKRSIGDELSSVFAFGERWGPENNKKDKHFGFLPGNGIHDIHMNQGNHEQFRRDDGVWQDGGLLIHFPEIESSANNVVWPEQWVAIFLAFQSQCQHTDDETGHCLEVDPGGDEDGAIRVVAALANPIGHDEGLETVTLLNTTAAAVDLDGWSLVDKNKRKTLITGTIAAGHTDRIHLSGEGSQLSNKGGIISLLNPLGNKVHGVSYTKSQVTEQGRTIVFG